jgi:hypothetical protein
MNEKLYPSDLTDEEWDFIKELIPDAKPGGRRRELCMRQVLNAIFYVTKGGFNGECCRETIQSGRAFITTFDNGV